MDALVEKLEATWGEWKPETAYQVRERVAEVIDLADPTFSISCVRARPNKKSWICSMSPQPGEVWLADLRLDPYLWARRPPSAFENQRKQAHAPAVRCIARLSSVT